MFTHLCNNATQGTSFQLSPRACSSTDFNDKLRVWSTPCSDHPHLLHRAAHATVPRTAARACNSALPVIDLS
jgi:hypothetical protein